MNDKRAVLEYPFETWENGDGPKPSVGSTRPGLTLNRIGLDRRATLNGTRTLHHGDRVPEGEPKRYLNGRGYVRLRWLVGPQKYVEAYEHRIAMGLPDDSTQVHHINGVKTDNRPENLQLLSRIEHRQLHIELGTPQKRRPRQPLSEYPACHVAQCERPAQCVDRTLCLKHYKRLRRHGSTSDEFGTKR